MKVEAWEEDGCTTSSPETIADLKARGLIGPDAKLFFSREFETWDEAMAYLHEFQGWEPYVPMTENP